MSGLSYYKRIIPAGVNSQIAAPGRFVAVRSATAEVVVTLRKNQEGEADGESYSLPMITKERWFHSDIFDSVEIQNNSGGNNTVEIIVGFGSFEFPPV